MSRAVRVFSMSRVSEVDARDIGFLVSTTTERAKEIVEESGALPSVERALRRAYAASATDERPLAKSNVIERELSYEGWRKAVVWYPADLPRPANDSFDGWRVFGDESRFGIAVEVEFSWNRVFFDLLKLWRGQHGGQIAAGIILLRSRSSWHYARHHQFALYSGLFSSRFRRCLLRVGRAGAE